MHTASSAKRTCSAPASTAEWTATERMPSMRHARMTRMAISPRLAMRIFENKARSLRLLHLEELLPELHRLAVLGQALDDGAGAVGLDLVHQLHRLDDAERLPLADGAPHLDEGRRVGRGRAVEGADE